MLQPRVRSSAEGGWGQVAQLSPCSRARGPACSQPTAEMSLNSLIFSSLQRIRGEAQQGKPSQLLKWDFRRILPMRKASRTPAQSFPREGKDAARIRQGGNPKSTLFWVRTAHLFVQQLNLM